VIARYYEKMKSSSKSKESSTITCINYEWIVIIIINNNELYDLRTAMWLCNTHNVATRELVAKDFLLNKKQ